jgi:ApbE superfamily uncharacterized protein (UPF0280 family)
LGIEINISLCFGSGKEIATDMLYEERTYQNWIQPKGLIASRACQDQSDLLILAKRDLSDQATDLLAEARQSLTGYIQRHPGFRKAMLPVDVDEDAPVMVKRMAKAAKAWQVGPMAAVAGAVAECVGEQLGRCFPQVIVENGGDNYVQSEKAIVCRLVAGSSSPFSDNIKFRVGPLGKAFGVCTSSGTVGHSYSMGQADAVCVVALSTPFADAAATAIANRIQSRDDVDPVLESASMHEEITGLLIACQDRLGIWGAIELI